MLMPSFERYIWRLYDRPVESEDKLAAWWPWRELLHIADATADEILKAGIKKMGLLGTQATMEQEFYKSRLEIYGIQVLIPGEQDRKTVHEIIFKELCLGKIREESRSEYKRIIGDMVLIRGVEGIILGCTEIPRLVKQEDAEVPLFDTTYIHAMKAVDMALNQS
jgi:aspartate racemase